MITYDNEELDHSQARDTDEDNNDQELSVSNGIRSILGILLMS